MDFGATLEAGAREAVGLTGTLGKTGPVAPVFTTEAVEGFAGVPETATFGATATDEGRAGGSAVEAGAAPAGKSSSSQPESRSSVSGVFCSLMLRPRRGSRGISDRRDVESSPAPEDGPGGP